jgi:hypothetical protein
MAAKQTTSLVKPLKLLMTADAAGGVWQYCVNLLTELARISHQPGVGTCADTAEKSLCATRGADTQSAASRHHGAQA